MAKRCLGCPVSLQSVDTNGSGRNIDIGMVELGQKEATGWGRRKFLAEHKLENKILALIRSSLRSLKFSLVKEMVSVDVKNGENRENEASAGG